LISSSDVFVIKGFTVYNHRIVVGQIQEMRLKLLLLVTYKGSLMKWNGSVYTAQLMCIIFIGNYLKS